MVSLGLAAGLDSIVVVAVGLAEGRDNTVEESSLTVGACVEVTGGGGGGGVDVISGCTCT